MARLSDYITLTQGVGTITGNKIIVPDGEYLIIKFTDIPAGVTEAHFSVNCVEFNFFGGRDYNILAGSNNMNLYITDFVPAVNYGTGGYGIYVGVHEVQDSYVGTFVINNINGWFLPSSHGSSALSTLWLSSGVWELTNWGIDTEPYSPGGTSVIGGGGGTFSDNSDPIPIPGLPTLSAVDTGFITLFVPTLAQLQALATYMWDNPLFDISTWKKVFADPMQAILGLAIIPITVPVTSIATVKVGNISTDVSMYKATSQYYELDCGALQIKEYWGSYLDYSPYTKAEIFLPYIGTKPIDVDEIMGKTIQIVYHIDILSGSCVAFIKSGNAVLYEFTGQVATCIPVTGDNFARLLNGAVTIASSLGTLANLPKAGQIISSAIGTTTSVAVEASKPSVEKSGNMSGSAGLLGIQYPYMILSRPRQALPESQNEFIGYPSFITKQISELSGYTEIEKIHLDNIPCTRDELNELESLLRNGVIF